jgi:multidrug efflux pump subunit AcrB
LTTAQELRAAADAVKAIVAKIPGARDVVDNDTPGRDELSLRVDVNAARNAGLDPGQVARLVRLHVDGEVVADLRDRGEKVELRVRAEPRTVARCRRYWTIRSRCPAAGPRPWARCWSRRSAKASA